MHRKSGFCDVGIMKANIICKEGGRRAELDTENLGVNLLVETSTSVKDHRETMVHSSRPPEVDPGSPHSDERLTKSHGHRDPSLLVHFQGLL